MSEMLKPAHVQVLLLPGWMNSLAGHWQTEWELIHRDHRVLQHDWLRPRRGDWLAAFQDHLLQQEGSTEFVLVAHSLGCHLVGAWATFASGDLMKRIRGALLVAPPDLEQVGLPSELSGWVPAMWCRLPFESRVVASDNDPFASPEASKHMAQQWGSSLTWMHGAGHINADSGLGDWSQGRSWVNEWIKEKQ